ncbi:DMT family transporter [Undibacterium sp. SXout11W]|uniref:DMT family transporter n=1 Tax=Undibacterium sp. SXout11W TaxID=3413050 RepID=UPI003BF22171
MMNWLYLGLAIICEVIATSALKASAGFTRPLPTVILAVGYGAAFYFLSLTLRSIPVGIAYAVWSGVGVVLISLVAWILYGQELDLPAMLGIGLIVAGVIVLNVFSKTVSH